MLKQQLIRHINENYQTSWYKKIVYYFFNDMISVKKFDPSFLNISKISFKSIDAVIYSIRYITMKSLDHVNIDSANSIYLVFNNVDGYIEESNGNKYLIFASTDKNKEILKNNTELWNEIDNQIETINGGEPIEYKKYFTKIEFESDNDLRFGKISSTPNMITFTGCVFQEDKKYYPQVYLHEIILYSINDISDIFQDKYTN